MTQRQSIQVFALFACFTFLGAQLSAQDSIDATDFPTSDVSLSTLSLSSADHPALAGFENAPTFQLNGGLEFSASDHAQFTTQLATDIGIGDENRFGFGLFADWQVGEFNNDHSVGATLGYAIVQGERLKIRLGFGASIDKYIYNLDNAYFGDQIDPRTGPVLLSHETRGIVRSTVATFSPSIMVRWKNSWINSTYNLSKTPLFYSNTEPRDHRVLRLDAGTRFYAGAVELSPQLHYKEEELFTQIRVNLWALIDKRYIFGMGYTIERGVDFGFGFQWNALRINASTQITTQYPANLVGVNAYTGLQFRYSIGQ